MKIKRIKTRDEIKAPGVFIGEIEGGWRAMEWRGKGKPLFFERCASEEEAKRRAQLIVEKWESKS